MLFNNNVNNVNGYYNITCILIMMILIIRIRVVIFQLLYILRELNYFIIIKH